MLKIMYFISYIQSHFGYFHNVVANVCNNRALRLPGTGNIFNISSKINSQTRIFKYLDSIDCYHFILLCQCLSSKNAITVDLT